jgi:hypothetical protein
MASRLRYTVLADAAEDQPLTPRKPNATGAQLPVYDGLRTSTSRWLPPNHATDTPEARPILRPLTSTWRNSSMKISETTVELQRPTNAYCVRHLPRRYFGRIAARVVACVKSGSSANASCRDVAIDLAP